MSSRQTAFESAPVSPVCLRAVNNGRGKQSRTFCEARFLYQVAFKRPDPNASGTAVINAKVATLARLYKVETPVMPTRMPD